MSFADRAFSGLSGSRAVSLNGEEKIIAATLCFGFWPANFEEYFGTDQARLDLGASNFGNRRRFCCIPSNQKDGPGLLYGQSREGGHPPSHRSDRNNQPGYVGSGRLPSFRDDFQVVRGLQFQSHERASHRGDRPQTVRRRSSPGSGRSTERPSTARGSESEPSQGSGHSPAEQARL